MISEVLAETKEKMEKAVEHAHEQFGNIRTGRANPALFDRLPVDYYGTPTPMGQLASFQQPEARMLVITPYDKSALKEIEKAIAANPNLGVNPQNDGQLIRVVMPELTKERRQEYVKLARDKAEEARVAVRNIRRKSKTDLDALESEVGEDEVSRAEKELDKITKSYTDRIDDAFKAKEADLLEV
ncbi:ribosome recycling factor [Gulosibacter chungangensis]|uniref:Ribosome-recycling factor n=1 Tax=Gulosibacter chungangensis TaxID=979746 RepID=A0A7J5BBL9_9MICO|nr:ribosome recycling factor [Gulosibacter chungangensis]KAB1642662.1 ribosome recycling factor [Gulosibacter chungangensis]